MEGLQSEAVVSESESVEAELGPVTGPMGEVGSPETESGQHPILDSDRRTAVAQSPSRGARL